MAEFQEVMRQCQRMCKSMQEKNMSCKEDCLLGHNPTCGELEYASLEEINDAETMIMKWAAEHPEPVYPTFAEWLCSIGVTISDRPFPAPNIPVYVFQVNKKMFEAIPNDIAQKLGIEPLPKA